MEGAGGPGAGAGTCWGATAAELGEQTGRSLARSYNCTEPSGSYSQPLGRLAGLQQGFTSPAAARRTTRRRRSGDSD